MSAAYDLYQQGRSHLRDGMPAQATVALEKAAEAHRFIQSRQNIGKVVLTT